MEKHGIDPRQIGRLEVGTESNLDRAKSVKSYLMQLFTPHGNSSVTGIDCVNACFGGTAALMNSVAWMEGREWDGRLAIVVATDVAIYEKGPARPTGGAGSVAILLGPSAPLVFERGVSTTHMGHSFDFYKPNPYWPYPIVDGKGSVVSYTSAVGSCRDQMLEKIQKHTGQAPPISVFFDHFIFHSPYSKLVHKAYARMVELDNGNLDLGPAFQQHCGPSMKLCKQLGNLYCASVYANLICLLWQLDSAALLNKRIGVFSYGSGLASMLFSIRVTGLVDGVKSKLDLDVKLKLRQKLTPAEFESCMTTRETLFGRPDWTPSPSHRSHHRAGVYVLDHVDEAFRRHYRRC